MGRGRSRPPRIRASPAVQPGEAGDRGRDLIARVLERSSERKAASRRHRAERVLECGRRRRQTTSAVRSRVRGRGSDRARPRRRAPPLEHEASPSRVRETPSCDEDDGDVRSLWRACENPQRSIERLVERDAGPSFRPPSRTGVQVRFKRELPQQRKTERVDGADGDVSQPIRAPLPSRLVEFRSSRGVLQLANDALAHLGRGLARERDRENVAGVDPRFQQVDITPDEHGGLPVPRRLEYDVVRSDCKGARAGVRIGP